MSEYRPVGSEAFSLSQTVEKSGMDSCLLYLRAHIVGDGLSDDAAEQSVDQLCAASGTDRGSMVEAMKHLVVEYEERLGAGREFLVAARQFMGDVYAAIDHAATAGGSSEKLSRVLETPETKEALRRFADNSEEIRRLLIEVNGLFKGDREFRHNVNNFIHQANLFFYTSAEDISAYVNKGVPLPSDFHEVFSFLQQILPMTIYLVDDYLVGRLPELEREQKRLVQWVKEATDGTDELPITKREHRPAKKQEENGMPVLTFRLRWLRNAIHGLQNVGSLEGGRVRELTRVVWKLDDDDVELVDMAAVNPAPVFTSIMNAIANAARESVGASEIEVRFDMDGHRGEYIVIVDDDGEGIPAHLMDRVPVDVYSGEKAQKFSAPQFTRPGVSGCGSSGIGTAYVPERMRNMGILWSVVSSQAPDKPYTTDDALEPYVTAMAKRKKKGTRVEWRIPAQQEV